MLKNILKKLLRFLGYATQILNREIDDPNILAIGSMLSNQQYSMKSTNINDYEFKIFSQWGDDGIIQYLIKNVSIENDIFIEFGVGNYLESNTRFLMMNNNWSGFVMDGSFADMKSLRKRSWFWKYNIRKLFS